MKDINPSISIIALNVNGDNELEVRGPTKAIETMGNGSIFTDLRLK